MVLGANLVRKEIGIPEGECLAADARFSLARQARNDGAPGLSREHPYNVNSVPPFGVPQFISLSFWAGHGA